MRLGIILNTNNTETAWNALRLGSEALEAGNEVNVFLLGSGVEVETIGDQSFDVTGALERFLDSGGQLLACGTCLKLRHQESSVCPVSTMDELVRMVSDSDKVVSLG
jgi:sulfur relay (sulfurtransferase) complex TusBCD TusD component (DsrE family)